MARTRLSPLGPASCSTLRALGLLIVLITTLVVAGAAGCGGGGGSGSKGPPRLVVTPAAALLPGVSETASLEAELEGAVLPPDAAVMWRSTVPAVAEVSSEGRVTAIAPVGSAVIFAEVELDGEVLRSAPVVVLVAQPAEGAVLLSDEQIGDDWQGIDAGPLAVGSRYSVSLRGVEAEALPEGAPILSTGAVPLGGRIVSVAREDGAADVLRVTIELRPLDELFERLELDLQIDGGDLLAGVGELPGGGQIERGEQLRLVWDEPAVLEPGGSEDGAGGSRIDGALPFGGRAATARQPLGAAEPGFDLDCGAEQDLSELLTLSLGELSVEPNLVFRLVRSDDVPLELTVEGSVDTALRFGPRLRSGYEGHASCTLTLVTLPLPPFPGPIGLLLDGEVPLGLFLDVDGSATLFPEVGFELGFSGSVAARVGLRCESGAGCEAIAETERSFESDGLSLYPRDLPAEPSEGQLELSTFGGLFYTIVVSSRLPWWDDADAELLVTRAGLQHELSLGLPAYQASSSDSASALKLGAAWDVGPGSAVEQVADFFGVDAPSERTLLDWELDHSPTGALRVEGVDGADPQSLRAADDSGPGDTLRLSVELDAADYLGMPALDGVALYWERDPRPGEAPATPNPFFPGRVFEPGPYDCASLVASAAGQTSFTCETTFEADDVGASRVYAFAQLSLGGVTLPVPLQLGPAAGAPIRVVGEDEEPPLVPDGHIVLTYDSFEPDQTASGRVYCGIHLHAHNRTDQVVELVAADLDWSAISTVVTYRDLQPDGKDTLEYSLLGEGCGSIPGGDSTATVTRCRIDGVAEEDCAALVTWAGHAARGFETLDPGGQVTVALSTERDGNFCETTIELENGTNRRLQTLGFTLSWPDGVTRDQAFGGVEPGASVERALWGASCETLDSGPVTSTLDVCFLDGVSSEDCEGAVSLP